MANHTDPVSLTGALMHSNPDDPSFTAAIGAFCAVGIGGVLVGSAVSACPPVSASTVQTDHVYLEHCTVMLSRLPHCDGIWAEHVGKNFRRRYRNDYLHGHLPKQSGCNLTHQSGTVCSRGRVASGLGTGLYQSYLDTRGQC